MTERTLMLGSEQNLDYLIVARRGESALGIKPIVAVTGEHGIIFMVRLRGTFAPSASVATKAKGLNFEEIWPEIKWENVAEHRVSTILAVPLGLYPWQYKHANARAVDAFSAILDRMALKLDHDIADVSHFVIEEGWFEELTLFEKAFPPHPPESPEMPIATYGFDLYPGPDPSVTPKQVAQKASGLFTAIEGGKTEKGPYSPPKTASHLKVVGDLPEDEEVDGNDSDSSA